MANPVWVTQSSLGTFITNTEVNTYVLAKVFPPATFVNYTLLSGSLPTGLTLQSSGYITGTITANYSYVYTFTILATDSLGNSSQNTFVMNVTLKPNQPTWITPAGSIGTFPSLNPVAVSLQAQANLPAVTVTYSIVSGKLPDGLTLTENGIITGIPTLVTKETTSLFTIRVTDNFQNIRDRSFSISVSGSALPQFITPEGNILETQDSIWIELPIEYNNPDPNNRVVLSVVEGTLPPGLQINQDGLIRGYADKPINTVTLSSITTAATLTETTNIITCLTTLGFTPNRPVLFSGATVFGGLEAGVTYYVKSIVSPTEFTISSTQNGPTLTLTSGTGFMNVTLPPVSVGQPTIKSYSFTLKLESSLGKVLRSFSITVINQNTPVSQNGPGKPANTRVPVLLNTRPRTYTISPSDQYYGYYIVPQDEGGSTYPLNFPSPLGNVQSNNYFAFKMIGYDFDGSNISYQFANLPNWLTGDSNTGWITGTPSVPIQSISDFNFSVSVYKTGNPSIGIGTLYSFSVILEKNLSSNVTWLSKTNLGTIYNGTVSTKSVYAEADVPLTYRITSGSLPPNLTLSSNGEIIGVVANQPTSTILDQDATTDFTFTIEAYSTQYPVIKSSKTFTITILQEFTQPTDNLYMKATPSIEDRIYVNSLLDNTTIIPTEYLYRPDDPYFGKASNIVYAHAYGIYASDLAQYIAAITQNHYWRNITLGVIETAVAKDENNEILYEVVYSKVIDNLINPKGISVPMQVNWPRLIDLNNGPWYTSITDIYTSYSNVLGVEYYTSRSPGYVNELYPNSLPNMRNRVGDNLGQDFNSKVLPLWMTSQQADGNTLGFTPAWVICYTKPGFSKIIKNNIETKWTDELGKVKKLNQINFQIDRFTVDKSITYNYDNTTTPPAWTSLPSATPTPDPLDSKDFYVLFPRKTILPE